MRRSHRHHHASRRGFRVRFGAALIATVASIVLLAGGLLPAGADEPAPVEQATTAAAPEETPSPPPEETTPPPPPEETPPPSEDTPAPVEETSPPVEETSSPEPTTTTSSTEPSQPELTAMSFSTLDVGTLEELPPGVETKTWTGNGTNNGVCSSWQTDTPPEPIGPGEVLWQFNFTGLAKADDQPAGFPRLSYAFSDGTTGTNVTPPDDFTGAVAKWYVATDATAILQSASGQAVLGQGNSVITISHCWGQASLTVEKEVVNDPGGLAPFNIHVECDNGQTIDDFELTGGDSKTLGIEFNDSSVQCTVSETNPQGAVVNISPNPVTLTAGSSDAIKVVTVTNTFTEPEVGSLDVIKVVEGPVPPGTVFEVTIDCTLEGSPLDGFPVLVTFDENGDLVPPPDLPLTGIPAGAECTVEETDDGGATSVAYDPDGGTPSDPPTVTIVAEEVALVTVTNTFVEVGGDFTGSVNVAKAIEGNPPPEGTQFVINVRCIGPTVDVDEDITLVYSSQLDGSVSFQAPSAESVQCTVTERDPLGGAIEASISPNNGVVTLSVSAPAANVVVTNKYGDPQVEVGGVTVTRGGTGQLPFTGGAINDVVKAAAVLLAVGAGLWLLARGRRRVTSTL